MTALFLMTGCFMIAFFLGLVGFIIYSERRRIAYDKNNEKRFNVLSGKIDETQRIFKNEVSDILKSIKNIVN